MLVEGVGPVEADTDIVGVLEASGLTQVALARDGGRAVPEDWNTEVGRTSAMQVFEEKVYLRLGTQVPAQHRRHEHLLVFHELAEGVPFLVG